MTFETSFDVPSSNEIGSFTPGQPTLSGDTTGRSEFTNTSSMFTNTSSMFTNTSSIDFAYSGDTRRLFFEVQ